MNFHKTFVALIVLLMTVYGCGQQESSNGGGAGAAGGTGGTGAAGGSSMGGAGGMTERVPTGLTISGTADGLAIDETAQLTAMLAFESGDPTDVTAEVTWSSSDATIVVLDESVAGMIRAVSAGQANITATHGDLTADALQVNVAAPAGVLSVAPSEFSGIVGDTTTFVVEDTLNDTVTDVSASVTWTSSDDAVVMVEGTVATIRGAGMATLTGTMDSRTVTVAVTGVNCDYPTNNGRVAFGEVVPDMMWSEAYLPDGTRTEFSLSQFYCSSRYADKTTLILVLGAGWCGPCSHFTANILNPQSEELVNMGAQILYLEAQDTDFNLATSQFAFRHIGDLIQEGPGIRAGEQDTQVRQADGSWAPTPGFVQGNEIVTGFPSVWVFRKRDMTMIADQGRSNFYLPFGLIVADPEADWSDPPPPPFRSNCEDGDEELTEPNDTAQQATRIMPGTYEGGICNAEPDFYRFVINGPWRATLEFDSGEGDLDMYVFDKITGEPLTDENGMAVGSNGTGDVEMVEHSGPAILIVLGYNSSSANYSLNVEAL